MTTLERLRAEGYRVEERWYTEDVMGFVRREIGRPAWPMRSAFAFMGLVVGYAVYRGIGDLRVGAQWFSDMLLPFGIGVLVILPLVVPHELIHGLAFRLLGARRVVYGAEWRQLVFHASAPGFPVGARGMTFVALAPFAVVTPGLVALAAQGDVWWAWLAIGALLMHTQGCLGDFAMVNYFARRVSRREDLFTFDEESGESFVMVCRPADPESAPT